ncbi:3-hydroxyacyl-ACP dehydratase FabZ family protein [Pantoea cypripedii]|uniref:Hydroxymyristoyl-ACP dehydratase n=1 Tax=Pantoea cypripedii TaxID=55209 RepID=A0A1X1ETA7_PANCY|nr:hydroxymyristoyl-ACP dehydratase [Pantoea cypripedii]MBP2197261.1 3-hydroxymyristoyl/3-hydroxydecanoyl-(acyl carrier protein) dehydratase [Pantoea cypripedii]ORM93181.1 hydroxymyristoyl-ACP dehydratase [Pantoea cypripedii]
MLPVELDAQQQATALTLRLHVAADLLWFRGHFPSLPILPGVAQLDWVLYYGLTRLVPGKAFASIENIKFQQPVLPDAELELHINWQAEKSVLSFQYRLLSDDGTPVASSGKIRLC